MLEMSLFLIKGPYIYILLTRKNVDLCNRAGMLQLLDYIAEDKLLIKLIMVRIKGYVWKFYHCLQKYLKENMSPQIVLYSFRYLLIFLRLG